MEERGEGRKEDVVDEPRKKKGELELGDGWEK